MPGAPRHLLHAFSTFKLGGPQARFVQLANAFGPAYRHTIVAMDNCFDAGERLGPQVLWKPLRLENRRGGALANRDAFRQVLQEVRPDLLLSYNWGAIEWAAANLPRRVPYLHMEDGFGPEEAQGQLPRRVWTRRVLLGWTRTPVAVASRHLETIACNEWKLARSRVHFIPNGVALGPASPPPASSENRPLTLGTVAGLRPEKNIGRLLRAFAALRRRQPARLLIVGDGAERANLQALAQALQVTSDVEFAGYLQNPQARLPELDLFALSSDTEQLPIAMLEAMAQHIPVVATRVGDVARIVPQIASTALAEPDDADFEKTLLRVVDQRGDWPAWAAAGYEQVRSAYSLDGMLAQWRHLFDGDMGKVFGRAPA